MSVRRLNKEATAYPKEGPIKFIGPVGDMTTQQWEVCPSAGVFKDRRISLKVTVPNEYPFKGPEVKLDKTLFHPNVNQQSMCLDKINGWTPSNVITEVVQEVHDTIVSPNLERAINTEAAELYVSNQAAYRAKAAAS
jgi:ubiquitin-protein ligase